jgi:hypothetical protein
MTMDWRRWFKRGLVVVVGLAVVIQAVPYGRAHDNPPVRSEPQWDSPVTRDLVVSACFDYHSNETIWPWYANIAPISWLTTRDVDEGRDELNFSDWGRGEEEADELVESVLDGEMPPFYYGWAHSSARLSEAETQQLIQGLRATFGSG